MEYVYVHQNNLENKIKTNYHELKEEIKDFYDKTYKSFRKNVDILDFNVNQSEIFIKFAKLLSDYYKALEEFSNKHKIESQSKFASSFLEEINLYLFKNLINIKNGKYSIYNNKIFRGLFVVDFENINTLEKNVDFCIGKEIDVTFGNQEKQTMRIPLVAVEVKTYTDATMFNEIKTAFSDIKNATPICHTYLLSGYVAMKESHISVAKGYNFLNNIFSLCKNSEFEFESNALLEYWKEVKEVVDGNNVDKNIKKVGRLLH